MKLISIYIGVLFAFVQSQSIDLSIKLTNKNIHLSSELNFCILIKYINVNDSLQVPNNLLFGYKDDDSADVYCIVQRQSENSTYVEIKPYADYSHYLLNTRKIIHLKNGNSIIKNINLNLYYPFSKGIYRVKFFYKPSIFNKKEKADISSNWVNFKILENISPEKTE